MISYIIFIIWTLTLYFYIVLFYWHYIDDNLYVNIWFLHENHNKLFSKMKNLRFFWHIWACFPPPSWLTSEITKEPGVLIVGNSPIAVQNAARLWWVHLDHDGRTCNNQNLFRNLGILSNFRMLVYRGFHEKGTLSYLCGLGIDRLSPLNECTLHVPFIWNQLSIRGWRRKKSNISNITQSTYN